ncbi:DUF6328 family protein [Streptomyces zhihengii]
MRDDDHDHPRGAPDGRDGNAGAPDGRGGNPGVSHGPDGRAGAPDGRGGSTSVSHGRDETEEERADRKWRDLLQELRVAQTGVQILFGFLLTVAFQPRFTDLSGTDQAIYTVTVMLGAAATGALVGPVALHRMVSGRRLKPQTVDWASRLTLLGLALLVCTMASALLLILRLVVTDTDAVWLVALMVAWFVLWWFALPVWLRTRDRDMRDRDTRDRDRS